MRHHEDQVAAAKDAALKALADRDLTRFELTELLVKRHDAGAVDAAILELEAVGVIDDRRVATVYIQHRLDDDKPSRSMLEAELLERGVDEGLVQTALSEAFSGRNESSEALEIARDRVRRSRADLAVEVIQRRVFAYLARRGYDEETCRQAVETATREYLGRP